MTDLSRPLASEGITAQRRGSETHAGGNLHGERWSRTVFVPQVHHVALLQLVQGRQRDLGPVHQIICRTGEGNASLACSVLKLIYESRINAGGCWFLPGELMQHRWMGSSSLDAASSMMPSASTTAHCSSENCSSCSFRASWLSRYAWVQTGGSSGGQGRAPRGHGAGLGRGTCCCSWACRPPSSTLLLCRSVSAELWCS